MTLTLEIVEGPDAGRQVQVTGPVVIGRDADVTLEDSQASRRHARVQPEGSGLVVEDLESTNGTFVNGNPVYGRAFAAPGDELLVGVTVFELRPQEDVARQPSAARPVPPPLAVPERRPTYTDRVDGSAGEATSDGIADLDRLVDARTKAAATTAPLAIFVIAALAVVIWQGA